MKKLYILALAATFTTTAFAQQAFEKQDFSYSFGKSTVENNKAGTDTLYSHFTGTPTVYVTASGYVIGQNEYTEIEAMQLFDATYGVSSTNGIIKNVMFWFAHAETIGTSSIWKATVWADNAGTPGSVLGSVDMNYNTIDTSTAGFQNNGVIGWNAVATFATPIAIPANQKFWVGMEFTENTGDSLGLVTTTNADFADAGTHTKMNIQGTYQDLTAFSLDAAMAIFPVLDISTGVEALNTTSFNVYPNPSTGEFNINLTNEKANNVNLTVRNVVGKTIISKNIQVAGQQTETISLADYSTGIYFLTIDNKTIKLIVE